MCVLRNANYSGKAKKMADGAEIREKDEDEDKGKLTTKEEDQRIDRQFKALALSRKALTELQTSMLEDSNVQAALAIGQLLSERQAFHNSCLEVLGDFGGGYLSRNSPTAKRR